MEALVTLCMPEATAAHPRALLLAAVAAGVVALAVAGISEVQPQAWARLRLLVVARVETRIQSTRIQVKRRPALRAVVSGAPGVLIRQPL